ncbi:hypothetical protein ACH5RR_040164 [Cinchona calisaya]|uniref:Protein BIG GRAIN 1-like B n=1 Tax=Cinchona calisaya TaxID=153742 RepID=A0ABD2XV78_9GENT
MSSWEKSFREEKSRTKYTKNPSFSSTLLDEIYRSIDGIDQKNDHHHHQDHLKFYKERSSSTISSYSAKKCNLQSNGGRAKCSSTVEDEEMASLKRACLIEKWMEKKVNDKVSSRRNLSTFELDNDPLFFSSTSVSSDSSSGGLSSSDTEFFSSAVKSSKKSCFASSFRPKPIRTSVPNQFGQQKDEFLIERNTKKEENLINSKSKALKIYGNLKKVKQPISPGGRLTSFINSLFTSGNAKKSKNLAASSTCSSASSFSRSCLSKNSQNSSVINLSNDAAVSKRSVRFYPVSIILDEDCRPCGQKRICDPEDAHKFDKFVRSRAPTTLSQNAAESKRDDYLKAYRNQNKNCNVVEDHEEDYDDEDAASDCSSDLFEIDHLALFGNGRFREELPVYETTHLDTNRAIANGLIR